MVEGIKYMEPILYARINLKWGSFGILHMMRNYERASRSMKGGETTGTQDSALGRSSEAMLGIVMYDIIGLVTVGGEFAVKSPEGCLTRARVIYELKVCERLPLDFSINSDCPIFFLPAATDSA
jgi:hypothetical protein